MALCGLAAGFTPFLTQSAFTQTVSPPIVENTGRTDGRFDLTNNTLQAMAVVLEPKSFDIGFDGTAAYRPLDSEIRLRLSTMSFRLEPQQTYHVFYKVHAEALPAWFTVYAVFSPIQKNDGVKLRIMLPHTVYLFQKKPIDQTAISIRKAWYLTSRKVIVCDLENTGPSLGRAQEVRVLGGKEPVVAGGFPMLPGKTRHIEIPWRDTTPPTSLLVHFPHFDVKEALSVQD